jgi:hypothetical protein
MDRLLVLHALDRSLQGHGPGPLLAHLWALQYKTTDPGAGGVLHALDISEGEFP